MDWWDKEPQWDPPVTDNNSVLSISVGGLNYDLVKIFANGAFIGADYIQDGVLPRRGDDRIGRDMVFGKNVVGVIHGLKLDILTIYGWADRSALGITYHRLVGGPGISELTTDNLFAIRVTYGINSDMHQQFCWSDKNGWNEFIATQDRQKQFAPCSRLSDMIEPRQFPDGHKIKYIRR